jgi:hypothetical protein
MKAKKYTHFDKKNQSKSVLKFFSYITWISAGFFKQSGYIFWLSYQLLHVKNQILA